MFENISLLCKCIWIKVQLFLCQQICVKPTLLIYSRAWHLGKSFQKFREGLAELQRGVDDVNDQAARFSAHNVPLTPANSAKLHDLNNR